MRWFLHERRSVLTHWPWETIHVLAIAKRLGLLLFLVTLYCVAASLVIRAWGIRLIDWGSAASVISTLILSLLMGFRNGVAYARWWDARTLWGQLTNDTRNLAIKLVAFVPAEVLAQSRVAELLSGFAEALKRHLRGQSPRLQDLKGFEQEEDDPSHVPLYLAKRLYAEVAEWKRAGHLSDAELWIIDPHLRGLMDVCGACEKIRNTPLAPSYKNLLRTGLVLNILVEPWLTTPEVGLWATPVFLIMCFFLLGIELIDSVVEEPFGTERDDLDLDCYCQTIRDSMEMTLPFTAKVG
jgi:putative membrane protein